MTLNVQSMNIGGSLSSGVRKSGSEKFPNPFCDIASEYMPADIQEMFRLAEYLWNTMPPFKEVGTKVVRYFLTSLELEGGSDQEREKLKSFLEDDLNIIRELAAVGDEFMVYGQSFLSLFFPFDRYLTCPECGTSYKTGTLPGQKFVPDANDPHYTGTCRKCMKSGIRFVRHDRRSPDQSRVKLLRWNPKRMWITEHMTSRAKRFQYDMGQEAVFSRNIKEGKEFFLRDTPWPLIKTCCRSQSSNLFEFNDGKVYHLSSPSLSGMDMNGWSVPPLLACFKLAYYIQLMRRFDEAIVMDFIVPFRVMYPDQAASGESTLSTYNMGSFVSQLQGMIDRKRKNITDVQIAPFRIGYQLLGGEAKMMSPKDSINQAMNELLNASGFPAELYNGTLSWQVVPVALRLFERRWGSLAEGFNDILKWIAKETSAHFGWNQQIVPRLSSITLADDIERKALSLQAAAGGDISKGTAYKPFGFSFEEEQKRVLEENRVISRLQREAEEQEQAQQLGGSAGDPAQQAGYSVTMDDVRDQAQGLAQQLLFQVPDSQRRSQLMKIRQTNPTLHALTIQALDELRRQMASQGQAAMIDQTRQQMAGGQMKTASAFGVGVLIQSEADYSRRELRKIASDCGKPGVRDAFGFVYRLMCGDTGIWF